MGEELTVATFWLWLYPWWPTPPLLLPPACWLEFGYHGGSWSNHPGSFGGRLGP